MTIGRNVLNGAMEQVLPNLLGILVVGISVSERRHTFSLDSVHVELKLRCSKLRPYEIQR